jgi:hypothetical protein
MLSLQKAIPDSELAEKVLLAKMPGEGSAMMRSKNSFLPKKQKSRLNAPPRRLGFDEPPKGGGWIWLTRELLESKAFRSLSLNACRALCFG